MRRRRSFARTERKREGATWPILPKSWARGRVARKPTRMSEADFRPVAAKSGDPFVLALDPDGQPAADAHDHPVGVGQNRLERQDRAQLRAAVGLGEAGEKNVPGIQGRRSASE